MIDRRRRKLDAFGISAWLYCVARREGSARPTVRTGESTLSLRHAGVCFALTLMLAPWSAQAQKPAMDCSDPQSPCASGAPCPLLNLPDEQFITAPPTDRGGRNIPPVPERPFDPEQGNRILVKGFVVDGVSPNKELGVSQQTVQAAANAGFMRETGGKPEARMTVGHMVKVADDVTNFYRSKGYVVAKAFLPVQTVGADSIVHIQVQEGRISDVVVVGAKRYSASVLRAPAESLIGTVPTRENVEKALLYIQDYPGVRLFGTFKPGDKLGETKLVLQVLDEDRFGFSAGADNYGTNFTGQYRARFNVDWHNPLGQGDNLNLSLLQAFSPTNTTYGSFGYEIPVGPRGFSIETSASRNAFIVNTKPFDFLTLDGKINAYELGANWKYERGRFGNAEAGLAYTYKTSKLDGQVSVGGKPFTLPISNDTIGVARLQLSTDRIDVRFKGVDQAFVAIRQGVNGEFTSSTLDSNFTIFEGRYTRVQSLAETQTAILRLRGQATGKEISPLEQFGLAGPDAVRAYPVGEVLRDNGQFASLEYQVQAPGFSRSAGPFSRQWGDLLQLALFGDYAHGRGAKSKTDSAELKGYGAGIHFGVPGTFQFVLEGSKPLGSRLASDGKDFRLYGNLTVNF